MCASEKSTTAGRCTATARRRPWRSNRKRCDSQTIGGVKSAQEYQYGAVEHDQPSEVGAGPLERDRQLPGQHRRHEAEQRRDEEDERPRHAVSRPHAEPAGRGWLRSDQAAGWLAVFMQRLDVTKQAFRRSSCSESLHSPRQVHSARSTRRCASRQQIAFLTSYTPLIPLQVALVTATSVRIRARAFRNRATGRGARLRLELLPRSGAAGFARSRRAGNESSACESSAPLELRVARERAKLRAASRKRIHR